MQKVHVHSNMKIKNVHINNNTYGFPDALRHLNASHNKIVKLPPSECWRCRLFYLDLSHNEIGVGVRKASLSRVMSV